MEPVVLTDVDGVVICSDSGVPFVIAKDMAGKVFVSQAGNKDFSLMLQSIGYLENEVPTVETGSRV